MLELILLIRRLFIILTTLLVIVTIGVVAGLFISYKSYQISKQDLEIRFGKEEERKKKIAEMEKKRGRGGNP